MKQKVLVVDDDAAVCALIEALLHRRGYATDVAHDGLEAVAKLRRSTYDAIVLDIMLPLANGFDVLQFVKAERPSLMRRVIVVTAAAERTLRDFDAAGVHALLLKPFDIHDLMAKVDTCAALARAADDSPMRRAAANRADA